MEGSSREMASGPGIGHQAEGCTVTPGAGFSDLRQPSLLHIGVDDTDSPEGMCTTYLAALLIRRLKAAGTRVIRARLIRLNPNVPWKTRGNAAVAILATGNREVVFETASGLILERAMLGHSGTHPGLVVSDRKPPQEFYLKALHGFCRVEEAREVLDGIGAWYRGFKLGRGLIGATAAIAATLPDRTCEILVYRREELFTTPRSFEKASFFLADRATSPGTWDTVDHGGRTVVCVPHTPDPVLFGIRGANPFTVARSLGFIRTEDPGLMQVFETNQGTDAHLETEPGGVLREGHSYLLSGSVDSMPVTGKGGHVSFFLVTVPGRIACLAFEPTKQFRQTVRALIPGDRIRVTGSFRGQCINLEKLELVSAARLTVRESPFCPDCGSRMTSAGRDKGFKCRRCSRRLVNPVIREVQRTIAPGWYEVPPSARRHLARPLIRDRS